ncbi:S24/S26 family peptidase [Desulfobacter curvatus]|uniref:S24/S26 family peptidase n=1 Tax=Desulfobacter curvatus TaxID=2290 RepID=UPI0003766D0E|nr:S24/S26 family peptidase [Desulfobacter curvatus]
MDILNPTGEQFYAMMTAFFSGSDKYRFKLQCPGFSMAPFIRHDSLLTLAVLQSSHTLETGDIVLAAMHKCRKMVVHRIVACKNNRYQVKGDNNLKSDGWFNREDLLGRVQAIEFNGRKIIPVPWSNKFIARASKTGLLNYLFLPAARVIKKIIKKLTGYVHHVQV